MIYYDPDLDCLTAVLDGLHVCRAIQSSHPNLVLKIDEIGQVVGLDMLCLKTWYQVKDSLDIPESLACEVDQFIRQVYPPFQVELIA